MADHIGAAARRSGSGLPGPTAPGRFAGPYAPHASQAWCLQHYGRYQVLSAGGRARPFNSHLLHHSTRPNRCVQVRHWVGEQQRQGGWPRRGYQHLPKSVAVFESPQVRLPGCRSTYLCPWSSAAARRSLRSPRNVVIRDRLAAGQVVLSTCPSVSIPSHSAHSSAGRDYGPGQLECEGGVGHERRRGHKGLSTNPSASAMADRVTPGDQRAVDE